MTLRPIGDQVIIRKHVVDRTPGGIVIPDTIKLRAAKTATVEAVGPGKRVECGRLVESTVRSGDVVALGQWHGLMLDGDDNRIVIRESEIIAIVAPRVEPMHDRLLVRVDREKVTKGGIIVPDNAKQPSQRGTVVAVGRGGLRWDGQREKPEVAVGDVVVFEPALPMTLVLDGEELHVIRERDCAGVLT